MKEAFKSVCKVHGEVDHRSVKRSGMNDRIVCTKCRSEAVKKRRQAIKQKALEYKGGKCQVCGYDKCVQALEFHHIDSSTKEFGIGEKGETRAWAKIKEELDKCILVCANCHREIHAGLEDQP